MQEETKKLAKPAKVSHQASSNEERTYKRGKADGRFGHPPAEATESYLRGYSDGLQQKH
jgi:hypothetical protein